MIIESDKGDVALLDTGLDEWNHDGEEILVGVIQQSLVEEACAQVAILRSDPEWARLEPRERANHTRGATEGRKATPPRAPGTTAHSISAVAAVPSASA